MGNNCASYPDPDTQNQCYTGIMQPAFPNSSMPNFCTLEGPAGDSYRSTYCAAMSSAGEWGDAQAVDTGTCNYDDSKPYVAVGAGCCDGSCGIIGSRLQCYRQNFTGDPLTCCFNDVACVAPGGNPPQCFSDAAQQNTCDDGSLQHNYRSIVSTDCQDVIYEYCTGTLPSDDPASTAWLDRWNDPSGGCSYAIARNIFELGGTGHCFTPPPTVPGICNAKYDIPFSAQGYFWAQQLVGAAMARFQEQGFTIGSLPGTQGYNPWQDYMYDNICCPYPGLCRSGLQDACALHTAQRLSLNPETAQWCGCYLPPQEYEAYSVNFNIPPQCTPMCNRVSTIPIVGINGEPIACEQDICLIDNVTLNIVNSQIGGGINFNQICDNCAGAQCSCIVSNTTVDISNSTIGGNVVPIADGCGSVTCSQTNPGITGPNVITVECGSTGYNPYTEYEAKVAAAKQSAEKSSWLWTIIAIGIGLVLIFIIIFFVYPILAPAQPKKTPTTTPTTATTASIVNQDVIPPAAAFLQAPGFTSVETREFA